MKIDDGLDACTLTLGSNQRCLGYTASDSDVMLAILVPMDVIIIIMVIHSMSIILGFFIIIISPLLSVLLEQQRIPPM